MKSASSQKSTILKYGNFSESSGYRLMNGMILWFSDISVQSKFVFTDQTLKRCRFLTLHFAIWNQHFPTRDGNKHAVLGLSVFTIAVTPTLISL